MFAQFTLDTVLELIWCFLCQKEGRGAYLFIYSQENGVVLFILCMLNCLEVIVIINTKTNSEQEVFLFCFFLLQIHRICCPLFQHQATRASHTCANVSFPYSVRFLMCGLLCLDFYRSLHAVQQQLSAFKPAGQWKGSNFLTKISRLKGTTAPGTPAVLIMPLES